MNPKSTNVPRTFLSLPIIVLGSIAMLGAVAVTFLGCWLLWMLTTRRGEGEIDAGSWVKAVVVTLFGLGFIAQALHLLLSARYKESAARARRRAKQQAEQRGNTPSVVTCRECQAEVSTDALACPYCGATEFLLPPPPSGVQRA